jgi:hypothetical protein
MLQLLAPALLMTLLDPSARAVSSWNAGDQAARFKLSTSSNIGTGVIASTQNRDARVAWIENRGQWPSQTRFVSDQPGARIRAECNGIACQLPSPHGSRQGVLVRLSFVESSPDVEVTGSERVPGSFNYFFGNDPRAWHTDVPAFAAIRYHNLYPGIDMLLGSSSAGLKYDLIIAPRTDPARVRIRVEGATEVRALENDTLAITTAVGEILHTGESCYEIGDDGAPTSIRCGWKITGDATFTLEAPGHDLSRALVIDPGLLWSTYLGGSGDDSPAWIAVDNAGDVVVTGITAYGSGFPQTPGTYQAPSGSDLFATKFRGTDGSLIYSSTFGGATGSEQPRAVAVDSIGQATVVGFTEATNFPVTPGAFQTMKHSPTNEHSGFVLRLSDLGNSLLFSTYIEGPQTGGDVYVVGIDSAGRAVIGGTALGQDFPTTPGAFQTQHHGMPDYGDGFVARLSLDGTALEWSTFLGGSDPEGVTALVVDDQNSVVAAGPTSSFDFPVTHGAFQTTKNPIMGTTSMFVSKLSSQGDSLAWSTYVGGATFPEYDYVQGIGLDCLGRVTVSGTTTCHTWPVTPGAFQTQFPPGSGGQTGSGFVTRLQANGQGLVASTFLTEPQNGGGAGNCAVDPSGVVTVAAGGQSGFPMTPGAYDTHPFSGGNFGIVRVGPQLDRLFYSTALGGPNAEVGEHIAASSIGRVSVTGYCYAPGGYPTTPNALQPNFMGGQTDAVVTTLDLLLQGLAQSGTSIPACHGPLVLNATKMPSSGAADFSVYCSAGPPNAQGVLWVGSRGALLQRVGGTGSSLHDVYYAIAVNSDSSGYTETTLPIPANSTGLTFSCQYVFQNTPTCHGAGPFSSSNVLRVTVQ